MGLEYYYKWISDNGINISLGYLFRFVMEKGRVLDKKLEYLVIYERLKCYLIILGIDEGEMLYSLWGGFVIIMVVLGVVKGFGEFM